MYKIRQFTSGGLVLCYEGKRFLSRPQPLVLNPIGFPKIPHVCYGFTLQSSGLRNMVVRDRADLLDCPRQIGDRIEGHGSYDFGSSLSEGVENLDVSAIREVYGTLRSDDDLRDFKELCEGSYGIPKSFQLAPFFRQEIRDFLVSIIEKSSYKNLAEFLRADYTKVAHVEHYLSLEDWKLCVRNYVQSQGDLTRPERYFLGLFLFATTVFLENQTQGSDFLRDQGYWSNVAWTEL